jgi:hypothetical protein
VSILSPPRHTFAAAGFKVRGAQEVKMGAGF